VWPKHHDGPLEHHISFASNFVPPASSWPKLIYIYNPFRNLARRHRKVDAVCSSIIQNSYKEKLGITKNSVMHFQLGDIFQSYDLSQLDEPFSIKEIEAVVKEIPTDFLPVLMVSMGCS
jgi:hypothetical protein